ncbi:hypothetical protein LEMLEM_LOCUS18547 [Lemmus lemmus]
MNHRVLTCRSTAVLCISSTSYCSGHSSSCASTASGSIWGSPDSADSPVVLLMHRQTLFEKVLPQRASLG